MSIRKKSRLSPDLIIAISVVVSEKVVKDDFKCNQVLKKKTVGLGLSWIPVASRIPIPKVLSHECQIL
jgi:hypothetical protein